MTLHARLPPDLQQWVAHQLPDLTSVTDTSGPRSNSKVWRVTSGTNEVYLKLSPNSENYAREICGYHHAVYSLADYEAPRLLAVDPDLHIIMITKLPGLIVKGLPFKPEAELQVHEYAGRLLRRWHDHPKPTEKEVLDAIWAVMVEQANEASACLNRSSEYLSTAERNLVLRVAEELPGLTADIPVVFRHGDFSPRNWLWDSENGSLGVIDFEKSEHGIAIEDLVWLHGAMWPTRPELKAAFFSGYGRRLSNPEYQALHLLTARLAVSYLDTGLTKKDPVLIKRGKTALAHLVGASG